MTGMVQMVANVFSLPSGRIVSAAGHQLPGLWEAIHHTLFTLRNGCDAPSGFLQEITKRYI